MSRKHVSTRRRLRLEPLEDRLCLSAPPVGATPAQPDAATQAHLSAAYGQLPLSFEANKGQTDPRVNFLSRGAGYSLFLTPTRAVIELHQSGGGNVVSMKIVGANPGSRPVGLDKQGGVTNYFIGNDPSKWHTDVPNYGEVSYQGVYRGVNLVYHGDQKQLEYDFVVARGADPRAIRLAFDGTQSKTIDAQGNLVLHTSGGDVVEHAPAAYQTINGVRHLVTSRFVIGRAGNVGFQVGRYDRSRQLLIDPVLSYSTYLGGRADDRGSAIAVDSSGSAYITGFTNSTNFPTKGPIQPSSAGGADVFVTKLNPTGTALVYSTYLGGSNGDIGNAIAVDSAGNAYVTGSTYSSNFPTTSPLQAHLNGGQDAFLLKLNPAGTALVYSTYLGGSGTDAAYGIAVGGSGNVYVTGTTGSTDFPVTPGAYQTTNSNTNDAFVAQVNAAGSSLVYATYLGGDYVAHGSGIAVDSSGNAYVTGWTGSSNLATAGAYQTVYAGGNDAFVAKLNAAGSALVYATYLGGSGDDRGLGIAVDGSGNAYVTGYTDSTNFPVFNAFQSVSGGSGDAFVTVFNASGSALLYSTYLGGNGADNAGADGGAIALDAVGNIYVTGFTQSTNFPTLNAFQPSYGGGGGDAFVAKINPTLSGTASLVYSSYLGGSRGNEEGYGIAVDSSGNAYVAGQTSSNDFPTTRNAFQTRFGGTSDAFVTKITSS
jgi:hypothetical protein